MTFPHQSFIGGMRFCCWFAVFYIIWMNLSNGRCLSSGLSECSLTDFNTVRFLETLCVLWTAFEQNFLGQPDPTILAVVLNALNLLSDYLSSS